MVSQRFFNILLYSSLKSAYHVTLAVQVMEGTHCGWYYRFGRRTHSIYLLFMWDLMNVKCSLIQGLMIYKFKLVHNVLEATKTFVVGKVKVQLIPVH